MFRVVLFSRRVMTAVVPLGLTILVAGHVQQAHARCNYCVTFLLEDSQLLCRRKRWHDGAHEVLLLAAVEKVFLWEVHMQLGELTHLFDSQPWASFSPHSGVG